MRNSQYTSMIHAPHVLALLLCFAESACFDLQALLNNSANWTHVSVRKQLNTSIIVVTFDTISLKGCASACTWSTLEVAPSLNFEQDHGRCHCNNALDDTEEDNDQPEVTYGILQINYKQDCWAYYKDGFVDDGVYKIQPRRRGPTKEVFCRMQDPAFKGHGWTSIQSRMNHDTTFTRSWTEYVNGFYVDQWSHWIGLEILHQITTLSCKLDVVTMMNGNYGFIKRVHATYSNFTVGSAATNYTLFVSGFEGNCYDFLSTYSGLPFSAPFGDNECANACGGGWWYRSDSDCGQASLNRMAYECPIWGSCEHQTERDLSVTGMMVKPQGAD